MRARRLIGALVVAVVLASAGQVATGIYLNCDYFPWSLECWLF